MTVGERVQHVRAKQKMRRFTISKEVHATLCDCLRDRRNLEAATILRTHGVDPEREWWVGADEDYTPRLLYIEGVAVEG